MFCIVLHQTLTGSGSINHPDTSRQSVCISNRNEQHKTCGHACVRFPRQASAVVQGTSVGLSTSQLQGEGKGKPVSRWEVECANAVAVDVHGGSTGNAAIKVNQVVELVEHVNGSVILAKNKLAGTPAVTTLTKLAEKVVRAVSRKQHELEDDREQACAVTRRDSCRSPDNQERCSTVCLEFRLEGSGVTLRLRMYHVVESFGCSSVYGPPACYAARFTRTLTFQEFILCPRFAASRNPRMRCAATKRSPDPKHGNDFSLCDMLHMSKPRTEPVEAQNKHFHSRKEAFSVL